MNNATILKKTSFLHVACDRIAREQMTTPTSWQALSQHKANFNHEMKDLFHSDPERFNKFHLVFKDILVDFSKNLITSETMALLFQHLELHTPFNALRKGLFSGEKINITEGRPVLHVYVS
jgi:glucose-6-phosphate isomerase